MIDKTITILGVPFVESVPATAEEWDAIAGPGDCLGHATTKVIYHDHAGPLRNCVVAAAISLGFVRAEKESQGDFLKRVRAEGIDESKLTEAAIEERKKANVSFAATLASEGRQRAAVAQKYIDTAEQIIAAWDSGAGTPERTLAKFRAIWAEATLPADLTDAVALAKVLRTIEQKQQPSFI